MPFEKVKCFVKRAMCSEKGFFMNSKEELTRQANMILKAARCRKDGRPSGSVDFRQTQFEKGVWHNRCCGKSRAR